MVFYIMEDMFTRVHYIFCRDFPKGWLRVTLKGIWRHREHTLKSKRTLYSFISFRFVKLVLPRGHKSRRRKCFPENRRTQLQVDVFYFFSSTFRLEICRDRRDRRSCKIFVSCVNFSKKQRSFLLIWQVYTHLNANFIHNC